MMCVLRLIVKTAVQDDMIVKDVTAGISVQRKGKAEKVIAIRRTVAEYGGTVEVRPYGKTPGATRDAPEQPAGTWTPGHP